jgi:hypothetical protein
MNIFLKYKHFRKTFLIIHFNFYIEAFNINYSDEFLSFILPKVFVKVCRVLKNVCKVILNISER